MNARCQDLRDRILSLEEGGLRVPDELRAHLEGCGECATWLARRAPGVAALLGLERLQAPDELERRVAQELNAQVRQQRIVETLRGLPRHAAPFELDGRVVAAAHGGHREDRAIAWLRDGLTPRSAPAELERRVAAQLSQAAVGSRAPAELDARLDRDLRDLEGTIAQRYAARLDPLPAPEMLRTRVHETLERVGRQRRRALAAVAALGLLAVSALALSGWRLGLDQSAPEAPVLVVLDRPEFDFSVSVGGLRSLEFSPLLKALAGALTTGLSEQLLAAPTGSGSIPAAWTEEPQGSGGAQETLDTGSQPKSRQAVEARDANGPNQPSSDGSQAELTDLRSQPFLEKLVDAPFQVRHSGERRIQVRDPQSGATLELREGVWSDGKGQFSVWLLDGGPADDGLFELMHNGREGFTQRYRDFRVRDLASFLENFDVDVLDHDGKVAGRHVVELEVARHTEPESRYRAAIDPLTGLVLRYEERHGPKGELVASVEYESIDLEPDLGQIELTAGPSVWLEFDLDELPPGTAENLYQPTYLPRHHQMERAATTKDLFGRSWVEFVYGDGVEQVFFLHADPDSGGFPAGPTGLKHGDSVRVARVGAWTILEGEIGGVPVAALGKVDLDEILHLVQSAFSD